MPTGNQATADAMTAGASWVTERQSKKRLKIIGSDGASDERTRISLGLAWCVAGNLRGKCGCVVPSGVAGCKGNVNAFLQDMTPGGLVMAAIFAWAIGMLIAIPAALLFDKLTTPKPRKMA